MNALAGPKWSGEKESYVKCKCICNGNVEVIDPPASKAQIGSEAVGEADTKAASESET